MKLVDITEVELEPSQGLGLLGSAIDFPEVSASYDTHAFPVAGWALGESGPAVALEVHNQAQVIRSFPVSRDRWDIQALQPEIPWSVQSGYSGVVGTVRLEPSFELELRVRLADGSMARIGRVRGRCNAIATSFRPSLQPLMITSLGRSGSTGLMQLLSKSPAIACDTRYPYELRVAKYWLHMLGVVTNSADHVHSAHPDTFHESAFWLGNNPFNNGDKLRRWMETVQVECVATHVQTMIERLYREVAVGMGKGEHARYFAEKTTPDRYAWLMHRLYGNAREVFLVRDFRDMYCSIVAFNDKRGFQAFGRECVDNEPDYLRRLTGAAESLRDAWRKRESSSLLVRYEDMISEPAAVVMRVLDYLGVPTSEDAAAAIVSAAAADEEVHHGHRTSTSGTESVGRWRRDLPHELWHECSKALDESLGAFGYEPTPHV